MIVHIPVTRHVKKYLLKEYAGMIVYHEGKEVLDINRKGFLGNFISNILCDDVQSYRIYKKPDSFISFKLSVRFHYHFITPRNAQRLEYYFDQMFKREFCKFLDLSYNLNQPIAEAIDSFYNYYNIEDSEYSRETMRRYYDRFGKSSFVNIRNSYKRHNLARL